MITSLTSNIIAQWHKTNTYLFALIMFALFWLSFVLITGTLTSGFHFTDDHELISIHKILYNDGFFNAAQQYVLGDFNIRFRPVYFFHRVALVGLFGTNYFFWSSYNLVIAIVTSFFLFLFAYKQGLRYSHAFIFPFLVLIGAQTSIWWRLGPNETIGMFLLSLALFLLVNSLHSGKRYQLIMSTILMVLASLSKESFVLFIPGYILLYLYFIKQKGAKNVMFNRQNVILILGLLVVFFIEIYIITFIIGSNQITYAGIDNSLSFLGLFKFIYIHLRQNKYIYLILFGIFLLFQSIKSWKISSIERKNWLVNLMYNIGILAVIVLPQFILYYKSGIAERYLLPLNLGFSFFVIFLLKSINENSQISLFTKRVFFTLIVFVSISFLKNDALPAAYAFAKEGEATDKFLNSIATNTHQSDSILIVLSGYDNWEWGYSIQTYLNSINRNNVKFYISHQPDNPVVEKFNLMYSRIFKHPIVYSIDNHFSAIAVLPFTNNTTIKSNMDSTGLYLRRDFDKFTIYQRTGTK